MRGSLFQLNFGSFALVACCLIATASQCKSQVRRSAPSLSQLEEEAFRAAAERVADSVVQIRTVGGLDRVGRTSINKGPTTGLIISADGYIVSSAFNFVQQPSSILIRLPSGSQVPAELVASDKNRMLVLLKVEADQELPVPEVTPQDQVQVGQWSVAIGRTFRAEQVGLSVGIVSATDRMYGRVIQTDANVSVANYGGPLVDIQGGVLGVLTPMSPQSSGEESEIAGSEFYDSGIGFAVPLEQVMRILPRLKQGEDLLPGKLGIGLAKGSVHVTPPRITTVWQGSPAAQAGWQKDDLIVAVNGKQVSTQAQLRFELLPRYSGDELSITVKRGDEEISQDVVLAGKLDAYRAAFLGVLPERALPEKTATDKKESGVTVREIWPESPAAEAGILSGDRLLKINDSELSNLEEAIETVAGMAAGSTVDLLVSRDAKELAFSAKLVDMPDELLPVTDEHSNDARKSSTDKLELKPLKLAEFVQVANYYSPPLSDERPHGLLLWLADGDDKVDQQLAERWQEYCNRNGLLLVIAHPEKDTGWKGEDLAYLKILLQTAGNRFAIDAHRIAVLGSGKAGQLAFALAFSRGSNLTGVVALDAPLPRTLKLPPNLPGRRLSILAVETPNSSFVPLIRKNAEELSDAGYPTSWWQRPLSVADSAEMSGELQPETISAIARWIDTLDRF